MRRFVREEVVEDVPPTAPLSETDVEETLEISVGFRSVRVEKRLPFPSKTVRTGIFQPAGSRGS